jgi:probable HAF family extracellular repeat protein
VVGYSYTAGDAAQHATLWPASGGAPRDLGTLGGIHSYAYGINGGGDIVGYSYTTLASGTHHAALWRASAGPAQDLGTLGGVLSVAYGINASGDIVGYSYTAANTGFRATLWPATGTPLALETLSGGTDSRAYGINASGQVTGYSDDGAFVASGIIWDHRPQVYPDADAGPDRTVFEGTLFFFDGSRSTDPNGRGLTYSWSFGDGSASATGAGPSHAYVDDGTYTATLTVSNGIASSTATTTTRVLNVAPTVGAITGPVAPVQVNTSVSASASFRDAGTLDTHTAVISWGDGTSSVATVSEATGSGSASGAHNYSATGVYTVTLRVTDNDGATAESTLEFVVVFDPAAGFVTGSGLIYSPSGAYAADFSLAGRATFGFVSSYQKGATVPSGNARFQFHAGDFSFRSTAFDWLVIAGPQAKFKGSGTVNGEGDFGFLISAVDGDVNGGGSTDKFRIKIWDKVTGSVIYDNQTGAADDAAATTVIDAGSISIHK